MQTAIPCLMMRGGTSKGAYFNAADLPADEAARDRILLAVMGSPDDRQIDGLGGADPLTSKVAVIGPSEKEGVDVDYLFVQVVVDQPLTSTKQNCGNLLAGVGQFAVERGLAKAQGDETTLRVHMVNSGNMADVTFPTPRGGVGYDGDARIDGVPGTAAPVMINFLDVAGSICGSLLPTGSSVDEIQGIQVTCIDNGMPVVAFLAAAVDRTGYESRDELNADTELKQRIEDLRLEAGRRMGLGDVAKMTVPKMTLLASPRSGGTVCTRSFIPHDCHSAIGVFAAVSVATALILPGTPGAEAAVLPEGARKLVSVEHPSGEFSVELETSGPPHNPVVERAALLRTARLLFSGEVQIPGAVWDGVAAE